MKNNTRKSILLSIAVVFAFIGFFSSSVTAGEKINWYSYKDGIKKANDEVKKIYLNLDADWCYYCKVMRNTSFKDPDVISYLNKHFIPITVNVDKEKKLAREYNAPPVPASWFLEADGSKIGGVPGLIRPKDLLQKLKFVYEEKYKSKR